MKTIRFRGRTPEPRCVTVGMQADHNAESVRFVVPERTEEYCLLYLSAGNAGDVVQLENGIWTPERSYMRRPARYQCYLERRRGSEMVWHSEPFELHVDRLPAIGEKIARAHPTLLDQVAEQAQKVEEEGRALISRAQAVEDFTEAVGKVAVSVETLPEGAAAQGGAQMDKTSGLHIALSIPKGDKGDRGVAGPQGCKGDTGAQGIQGEKGDKGERGDIGPQGETGPRGLQGLQGEKGEKGDKGDTGATGSQGPKGVTGAVFTPTVSSAGLLSWSNNGGLSNPASVNIKGPKGDTGAQGSAGAKGDKGDTGAKGNPGAVFTPAVAADGTLSWSNNGSLTNPASVNIKGPKGDKGATGAQGPKGATGATGPQGPKGDTGWARCKASKLVTVAAADWVKNSATGRYEVTITDAAIAETDILMLVLDDAQKGKFALGAYDPVAGHVTLYADSVPGEALSIRLNLFNQEG